MSAEITLAIPPSAPRLLVSVRSAAEAAAALEGGADLIDVKEPLHGPLGRADDSTLEEIVRASAGRRPVSAALGELSAASDLPRVVSQLAFVKWGLAGWQGRPSWRDVFSGLAERACMGGTGLLAVPVAYADWQLAQAPSLEEVAAFAQQRPGSVLLLDTWQKEPTRGGRSPTLLDWVPVDELMRLCRRCREAGVGLALAGALDGNGIARLLPIRPAWFAVRSAACEGGRNGTISAARVRKLAALLNEAASSGN